MIKLENVYKYYNYKKSTQINVIDNTSLTLPEKGLVCLLGPSGCGKTTLLNTIGGLDKVKKGQIYIDGKKITGKSSYYVDKIRNLNIGYIFQNYYLINNQTVFDNVALSLKMIGIKDKEEIKKRVNFVLETIGMYRYRNRLCNMLSGGQRQRVGIARAIVKNPRIIIADEPTGNLDSANTLEIMNIVKSISKNRLVILVTHESNIAKFYADRIIEIKDGKITKDYDNQNDGNLDYRIENKFYLKDFKHQTNFENKDNNIEIYNDKQNDLKLTIVVKNNNIFIKGAKNSKIEVVDENSNIEFINDHYKEIDKSIYEKYEFKFEDIIDKKQKPKYSSIFNPITLITNGFKKIFNYNLIRKLLLLGFLASGAFITYSICNIFGITKIEDSYFIMEDRAYYNVKINKITNEEYNKLKNISSVDYILPNDSISELALVIDDFYQTSVINVTLSGSLMNKSVLTKEDLVLGRMPQNKNEIVVDKLAILNMFDNSYEISMAGYHDYSEILNKKVKTTDDKEYLIVGISDTNNPSIYVDKSLINNIKYHSMNYYKDYEDSLEIYQSKENLNLVKGVLPSNDYEVVVNINNEFVMPINKQIDLKVNGHKLKVVGYYEDINDNNYYVSENTIVYKMLEEAKSLTVMPKDEENIISDFNNANMDLKNTYDTSLKEYKEEKSSLVNAGIIASSIIIAISFIEIYLMERSSFLSRIKEVGTLRAIGVRKSDIYKMFFGEIFAVSTIACVPGSLFVAYALNAFSSISYFSQNYVVNFFTITLSIIVIYLFNLIVGLLPVMLVLRNTPADILARKDID